MIPWSVLDTTQVPGGGGELRLKQRGAEFSIMLDHNELMNSRLSGSEEALATIACEKIRRHKTPRILIGGLGMGFTLRAALVALGPDARLVVDNGPEGLTRKANDALYDLKGLGGARAALRLGGVLAVWSSGPNPKFTWRLHKAGFEVEEVRARANGSRGGARHVIWIATRA